MPETIVTETATVSNVEEIVVKRRGFNLDTFERESLENKISFTHLPKDSFLEELNNRVGGDSAKVYDLVNYAAKRFAVLNGKNILQPDPEKQPNWIPSAATVLSFINTFRGIPPYVAIGDRKKQTTAIVAFLKASPAVLEALKTLAKTAAEAGEVDEEEAEV